MVIAHKSKTFLATTALEEFWDTAQPILFLGDWCTLYNKKAVWKDLDAETLNFSYTQAETEHAYIYTTKIFENLLPTLAAWLNSVHGTQYSLRYWQILIGPFLFMYIRNLYNKVDFLKKAYNLYPDISTIGLAETSYLTPLDTLEFLDLVEYSDAWNLQLFTQLLSLAFRLPIATRDFCWTNEPQLRQEETEKNVSSLSFLSRLRRRAIDLYVRIFSKRIVAISQHLHWVKKEELYHLFFLSAGRILPLTWFAFERKSSSQNRMTSSALRNEIIKLPVRDDFSHLVLETLKTNMPLNFIECYAEEGDIAQKAYPFNLKGLTVEVGIIVDDTLKFWMAKQVEQGTRIVGVQHGGGYWLQKNNHYEVVEHRSVDQFISWGWTDGERVSPASSSRISGALLEYQRKHRPKEAKNILWVGTLLTRYPFTLAENIYSNQQYVDWQKHFFDELDDQIVQQMIMRLHPDSLYYDYYRANFHNLNVVLPQQGNAFIDDLCSAKIFIGDNMNTTQNYALAFNIPTILFPDLKAWGIREEALPYFASLKEVGIFHETPESAAMMLNRIAKEPGLWWQREEVQAARRQFCEHFARTSPDWSKEWKKILLNSLNRKDC